MEIRAALEGFREAAEAVRRLNLPPAVRRRWLARKSRMVIAQAQKNIRDQKTVDGSAFKPRSPKSIYHGLLLKNLARSKWLGLIRLTDNMAKLGYPPRKMKHGDHAGEYLSQEYVAGKHQYGGDELFRRKKQETLFSEKQRSAHFRDYWSEKCSDKQAVELIRCGYRRPKRYIMENVTVGHAWEWLCNTKEQWRIRVPARPFLGANEELMQRFGDELLRGIRGRFRAKNHADLLK